MPPRDPRSGGLYWTTMGMVVAVIVLMSPGSRCHLAIRDTFIEYMCIYSPFFCA
jgi:hypothetical protein